MDIHEGFQLSNNGSGSGIRAFTFVSFLTILTDITQAGCCHTGKDLAWFRFKKLANREYEGEEEFERYRVFRTNMAKVEQHNAMFRLGLTSYDQKMNKFGDLTPWEFQTLMFGSVKPRPTRLGTTYYSFSSLTSSPNSLDLRSRGMITPVKDQGYCASGAIFSAIGVLEGGLYKKTKKLVPLSEQQVLDCSPTQSCSVASFSKAVSFLTYQGSIRGKDYPFEGMRSECREFTKQSLIKFPPIRNVALADSDALEAVLDRVGPVSIQMSTSSELQFYNSGVFDELVQKNEQNFAALIVGYGTDPDYGDYWLVKNNWGANWGEKGYIRISKYANDPLVSGTTHFAEL